MNETHVVAGFEYLHHFLCWTQGIEHLPILCNWSADLGSQPKKKRLSRASRSQLGIVKCKAKPMVGWEGEFHRHVLAILSSHPLQLLRVLDVHRLEEQRRNVRFFFSHKISSKGGWDSWRDLHHLQLHLLHVSRTCLRHLVVFVRLLVSCQKYALQRPCLVNVNLCGAVY